MSTTAPSQTELVFSMAVRPHNRFLVVATAFWHTLRRDIMITARGFVPFVMQVLIFPFSLLFVFGRILPSTGVTQQLYPALFFPGVVAMTIFMASLQGISLSLMLDLDGNHEIDDRLLAPLPVSLVAVEKIVFSAIRSLVAAGLTFIVAYFVLGNGYLVRSDYLGLLICVMTLYALSSAALGLVIGSALSADKIYLLFTLIFSATLYTGCIYYTWSSISSIKALQIITLFNPLTYAAEGLRFAMVPPIHGQAVATLPFGWDLLGLTISFIGLLFLGIRIFRNRVIS